MLKSREEVQTNKNLFLIEICRLDEQNLDWGWIFPEKQVKILQITRMRIKEPIFLLEKLDL